MAPIMRIGNSGPVQPRNETSRQPETLLDLRQNYRFPGSNNLRQWKDEGPQQEATRKYGEILRADRTSQTGFHRLARIGDGTTNQHDDRVAIGLVLDAINSGSLEQKRTGLEYMQSLLSQPMSPEKTQFVYDSIVNNLINAVGWKIEEKQDYHSGRQILSQLDSFSLLMLRQYNIYPNLDLASLLQSRQLPNTAIEGGANFADIRAYLHTRLSELRDIRRSQELSHDPLSGDHSDRSQHRTTIEGFSDYEGFRSYSLPSILLKGLQMDFNFFTRPVLVRV